MARMRVILVLLVAIAAGGGLAYGTYNYVRNVPTAAAPLPTRPVVVAAADLASAQSSGPKTSASSTGPPPQCPRACSTSPRTSLAEGW